MNNKFYTYDQNNSWWVYIVNYIKWIWAAVIIEAKNKKQAENISKKIWIYFDWVNNGIDCECCWDRWIRDCSISKKIKIPWWINIIPLRSLKVFVHYLNWTIKLIDNKK